MARYVVKDIFKFEETLIETDDLNIAYDTAVTRIANTGGKCAVSIQDMQTPPYSISSVCEIVIQQWKED